MKLSKIVFVVAILGMAEGAIAEFHGRASYSLSGAQLEASSVDAIGWEVKDDELVSLASGAELELWFGEKWWQYFYIEGYSTTGIVPEHLGTDAEDDAAAIYLFSVLLGQPGGRIPALKISSTAFEATAVVTGSVPVYENGVALQVDDEFDVGLTHTSYLLLWNTIHNKDAGAASSYFHFGAGVANVKYLGTRQEGYPPSVVYADETVEGWGAQISGPL